jgi:hypothetical protein
MIAGSYCVIAKKYPEYAVGALLSVVVVQGTPSHPMGPLVKLPCSLTHLPCFRIVDLQVLDTV